MKSKNGALTALSAVFIISLSLNLHAQQGEIPRQQLGFEFGVSYVFLPIVEDYDANPNPGVGGISLGDGVSGLIGASYLYNPYQWLGLQTGLHVNLYRGSNESLLRRQEYSRNIFTARVPAMVSLRPFSWFAVEGGFGFNVNLFQVESYELNPQNNPTDLSTMFLDYEVGVRFNLSRKLSTGFYFVRTLSPVAFGPYHEMTMANFNFKLRYFFWEV